MINLMYVVLMALLAMNVSTEVLNGFSIVDGICLGGLPLSVCRN